MNDDTPTTEEQLAQTLEEQLRKEMGAPLLLVDPSTRAAQDAKALAHKLTNNPELVPVAAMFLLSDRLAQQLADFQDSLQNAIERAPTSPDEYSTSFVDRGLGEVPPAWREHLAAVEHQLALTTAHNEELRRQLEGKGQTPWPAPSADFGPAEELAEQCVAMQERAEKAEAALANYLGNEAIRKRFTEPR